MTRMARPSPIAPADTDLAYAAAQSVVEVHRRLAAFIKEGMTLARIDTEVARTLSDLGCRSCFLGYRVGRLPPFPSHACLSVNACVVHGAPAHHTKPLQPGDLLSLDIGVWNKGWIGDAAWTYAIREVSDENRRLMNCGKESLRRGLEQMTPGAPYLNFAKAVQVHVERECGFHCVRGLGGHGIGRKLHGPPFIANVVPSHVGEWAEAFDRWTPGTLVAIEPMIAVGTGWTVQGERQWPIMTADGSASVHYEADVLITDNGPQDLTQGMTELPDIIG